ncbi:MAG: adenylate/guanylate cyclase domain-containing protein [Chthoniobacterales bacterium]
MKRSFVATLWIGTVATAFAVALSLSGLLARPAAWLAELMDAPNEPPGFAGFLLVIILAFAVAWTLLQVPAAIRRAGLVAFVVADLLGGAWVLGSAGISFAPLPAIVATAVAALLVVALDRTQSGRQRQSTARLFVGRLAQPGLDRLTESAGLDLAEPATREASFIFCEIANQTDLIDELPAAVCAQLTREFTDYASARFLREGGYLHGADGEGVRVLFGFPNASEEHALEAARAALAFRDSFRAEAVAKPESLGKIDLRIGVSSGVVVATRRDDTPQSDIVVSGEPFEVARRLARVNQVYGSQILLGPRTFSAANKGIVARPIDFLRSAVAHERLEVYELLALAEKATPEEVARRDCFWTGVVFFRERRWNEAFAEFNRARGDNGQQDQPLQWYLRRLEPLCLNMATEPAPVGEPLAPL